MSLRNETNWTAVNGINTTNETQRCFHAPMSRVAIIGLTIAYAIVFIIGTIGNSIIIYVVRMRLKNRVPFNLLIVNMAVCDIIYAFAAAPFGVHFIWVRSLWFDGGFGVFLCKFKEYALLFSISTSILTLTVMSADRYLAIVHVLKRPLSRRKVFYAIAIIWVVSLLLSSGELVKANSVAFQGKIHCLLRWNTDKKINVMINRIEFNIKFITFFALPLVIMVSFYYSIIRFLWLRKVPGVKSDENDKKIKRQCQKVVLMLVSMLTVFAVGWLPVHVAHYLSYYTNHCNLPLSVLLFMVLVAHANSAINPCLYIVFNNSFREEFYHLVAKCLRKDVSRTMSSLTLNSSTRTLPTTVARANTDSLASCQTSTAMKKDEEITIRSAGPHFKEIDDAFSDTRL